LLPATLALSLVVSSLKLVCCDFSMFSAMMPRSSSVIAMLEFPAMPNPFKRDDVIAKHFFTANRSSSLQLLDRPT